MSAASLTVSQIRYVNKAFWRNPARAFFTFAFPLMFLVIFTSLLGNGHVRIGPRRIPLSTYYVAAMAAYAVITACFTNIAITVSFQREAGILKRIDGTPLPKPAFFASRILHGLGIAVVLMVLTAAFGRIFYQADLPAGFDLFRFVVMLAVGACAFCALGLAVTVLVPNADAAAPVVQAVIFPLLFLSGIFVPFGNHTPAWILWIARIFPVRHFAVGMLAGFVGTPFSWTDVVVVAVWGVAALVAAVRFFSWEPHAG